MMTKYNKRLSGSQLDKLLAHTSSENPLWLTVAGEELCQYSRSGAVDERIYCLPDGILKYVLVLSLYSMGYRLEPVCHQCISRLACISMPSRFIRLFLIKK
jgi:hypothetical protein